MNNLNWDKVNWRDLVGAGPDLPPLIKVVALAEPDRWIEVKMTYGDLLFIKDLVDDAVVEALIKRLTQRSKSKGD